MAKCDRGDRELWARTLIDRFDAARREFWPDAELPTAPSGKLRGQWERYARSWRRTDISVADWIAWSVENWRGVYVTVFQHVEHWQEREAKKLAEAPWGPKSHWRTRMDCPDYPDLGFLLRYENAFQKGYDHRASQKIRAGLTREDELMRRLMFRGFSYDDAKAEAAEIMAKDKKREDLEARERELNAKVRRVEAKEQNLDNRIAIGRSYQRPVQPVARERPKSKFATEAETFAPLPPLPPSRAFKDHHDDPDECPELTAGPGMEQQPSGHPVQIRGHM